MEVCDIMIFGACSDIGRVRKENEDSFYVPAINDNLKMFLIADGIGGQGHGKLASMMTVDEMLKYALKNVSIMSDKSNLMLGAIKYANDVVKRFSEENPEFAGMGTTLAAMIVDDNRAVIANAGDSRCYMIRKNIISQLTIDNSYVQYLVEKGIITNEEAQHHPQKNLITKAIGLEESVEPEIDILELKSDDIVLLCTDGLTNMLCDEELLHIILEMHENMQSAAEALVKKAKENGGTDNITAILVQI